MNVLGVDQSLTMTGLARVVHGVVATERVSTIPTSGDPLTQTRERIRYIVGRTLKFAPPGPLLSVVEAPYVPRGGKAAGAVTERAWLFGLLVDQLLTRGLVVQVRTTTRAMYATDNGSADKKQVLAAMRAKHPLVVIADDNAADALALVAMGARYLGSPIDGVASKKQLQAMTSTVWPSIEGGSK